MNRHAGEGAPLLGGHGVHASFSAYFAAFSAHFCHHLRNNGSARRSRFGLGAGSADSLVKDALGVLDGIQSGIRSLGAFTTALWHGLWSPRQRGFVKLEGISN